MKKLIAIVCVAGFAFSLAAQEKAAGDAAKGKEVFEGQPCAACHSVDSDEAKAGPPLKGLYKREKMKSGAKVSDDSVKKIIKEGSDKGMPAAEVTDEELTNLVAYLKSL